LDFQQQYRYKQVIKNLHRYSKRPHIITQMNDKTNTDVTLAESMNAHS
jgi:hypothetical protein